MWLQTFSKDQPGQEREIEGRLPGAHIQDQMTPASRLCIKESVDAHISTREAVGYSSIKKTALGCCTCHTFKRSVTSMGKTLLWFPWKWCCQWTKLNQGLIMTTVCSKNSTTCILSLWGHGTEIHIFYCEIQNNTKVCSSNTIIVFRFQEERPKINHFPHPTATGFKYQAANGKRTTIVSEADSSPNNYKTI